VLAISAGVAILRGGRNCRDRRDDRDRTVLGIIRYPTLRVLRAALLPSADLSRTTVLCAASSFGTSNCAGGTRATYASASDESFPSEPCAAYGVGCILFLPGQQGLLPLCCQLRRCVAVRPNHSPSTVVTALNLLAAARALLTGIVRQSTAHAVLPFASRHDSRIRSLPGARACGIPVDPFVKAPQ